MKKRLKMRSEEYARWQLRYCIECKDDEDIHRKFLLGKLDLRRTEVLSVLDVGCDGGFFLRMLAKGGKYRYLIGLDNNLYLLKYAKRYAKSAQFILGDACNLPFKRGAFDVVCAMEIIEHLRDALGFLREVRRVTKPQSKFLLTTPNLWSLPSASLQGLKQLLKRLIGIEYISPVHEREFTILQLVSYLKKAGFILRKYPRSSFVPLIVKGSKIWLITESGGVA
jgi:SAM-dependent methyltransferase